LGGYNARSCRFGAVLGAFFGDTCFELNYARAISDEVTAHFKVALVGVRFSEEEQAEYEDADGRARRLRSWLINNAGVAKGPFRVFMADVSRLAEGGHEEETGRARAYLNAFSRRRQILADTSAKLDLLDELAPAVRASERVIVFTERQEAAEEAAATLSWQGIRAGAVHSGLPIDTRRDLMSQFAQGSLAVLCAPRILDEGVDVPAVDLGIIMAASQSRRQMVQRMGRVLRRKSDGRYARFVIAYVVGTSEDPGEGAHGAFLEDITEVADDVVDFGTIENGDGVCEYLNDYIWNGPIPQPRMAPADRR
jgi:superfamily II DNA or RNA helicase